MSEAHRVLEINSDIPPVQHRDPDDGHIYYESQARVVPGFCYCELGETHFTEPEGKIRKITRNSD